MTRRQVFYHSIDVADELFLEGRSDAWVAQIDARMIVEFD